MSSPSEKVILHVDDDEIIRNIVRTILTVEGFKSVSVASAQEASAALRAQRVDLVVADLVMPGRSGTAFLRELKNTAHARNPVFVVTGLALDADATSMIRREANIVEFITKPLNIDAFVAALHKHLRTAPAQINAGPVSIDSPASSAPS